MTVLGGIGFTAPWLLLGLLALPVLWIILRAVPPAPIRRRFPGVALLLGLRDDETVTDRTPWWLLLLRMLAVAAMIVGLAGPVLNPTVNRDGNGPLLIVLDGTWAGAGHWGDKIGLIQSQLQEAGRAGRPVGILQLTAPEPVSFQAANAAASRLPGLKPMPWSPSDAMIDRATEALAAVEGDFDTHWFGDGLAFDGRDTLIAALQERGAVSAYQTQAEVLGLAPASFEDNAIQLIARRSVDGPERTVDIIAQGRDPAGNARVLAQVPATFQSGASEATAALSLPAELRARITRFELRGLRSAGALSMTDDALRRREVALIAGRDDREGLELLSPLHYLEQALAPSADLLTGALGDLLPANPDVVVLADIATLSPAESDALAEWIDGGGMLLRFAGPRLAASDVSRDQEDPLMPVRLRAGGRSVGGAMSWGEPKTLAPFAEESPFYGLPVPEDVTVTAQVMAQPDPNLANRVIASLSDGTPLVTRKAIGQGQVVLFHVTANAEWSSLPLSGLFVEMLERLAVSSAAKRPSAADLEGTTWTPVQVMDGFGTLSDAGTLPGVAGPALAEAPVGPDLQPGLYRSGDRRLARNVLTADTTLAPAAWPASIPVTGLAVAAEWPLGGALLVLALALLVGDIVASLALSGRLSPAGAGTTAAIALAALLALPQPAQAQAQDDPEDFALAATSELVLAHVITGNPQVDDIALAGLRGLADTLYFRTSVEPSLPMSINLETDELAFFPLLYWPVTPDQPIPSDEAYAKLNAYLRSGGMILFDTRDADVSRFGAASPTGRKLQQLAAPLDIPPLEPLPADHVLTRTFYLLQDFPGRHAGREVWVEAAPPDAEQIEGMPFRNLNDGVTPVVIGGNDWAAAWAVDREGRALLPVGRGFSGERQRELAFRFGVNLVMHVLTGNYKSDQVHVPALLDRLGQ
ncbi:MAG: LytTR family transcriptional regulator [Pseudooceanicola sp.]|nr:LytTR family transcriptional regulator [Pseudooceanicola sp.]